MSSNHWMMFGTFAEKRHFAYPNPDTYEGIFINANMAAHVPDAIAKFIQTHVGNSKYIIEPQTHAFQHNPKFIETDVTTLETDETTGKKVRTKTGQKKLKESIQKLVEQYGDPVLSIAGQKPAVPSMFSDGVLSDFVERCLNFQRNFISERMANSEDSKYTSFDQEGNGSNQFSKPYAIIPPYFYFQETTFADWLAVNVKSLEIGLANRQRDEKMFAMLALSQGVLINSELLDLIILKYRDLHVDGFVIWVDDLAEYDVGTIELSALVKLASSLNNGSNEVINLHGSYFSVLTTSPRWTKKTFTGVCHGPEFGEHRGIVPVGGGIPIARYYIPSLHRRIRYRETIDLFSSMGYFDSAEVFHRKVCNCQECRETINGDIENYTLFGGSNPKVKKTKTGFVRIDYPTTETKLRCLRHYLQRKHIEYQFALTASTQQIRDNLIGGRDEYGETMGSDGVEHLGVWESVLAKTLNASD